MRTGHGMKVQFLTKDPRKRLVLIVSLVFAMPAWSATMTVDSASDETAHFSENGN